MKKIRKGKILAGGLFALAGIAVGGVGFSSWIVTINQTQTLENITVSVSNTEDKSIKIFYAYVKEGKIKFDGKNVANPDERLRWVADSTDPTPEDLSFTIKYYVAVVNETSVSKITATFTMEDWFGDYVTNTYASGVAITKGYNALAADAKDKLYVVAPFGDIDAAKAEAQHKTQNNVLDVVDSSMTAKTNTYAENVNKSVTTVSEAYTKTTLVQSIGADENHQGKNWDLHGQTIPEFTGGDGYKYYAVETTFSFAWSAKTNHLNPVEYVSTLTGDSKLNDADVQELANDLAKLKALDNKQFNIELAPVAAVANN